MCTHGKVQILAPEHFTEHAVSENLIAGPAMARRSVYMYGSLLPRNPQGSVSSGLGMTTSSGRVTFLPPTREVTPSMIFDYLSVRINPDKVAGKQYKLNINFTDRKEQYGVWVENSVLHFAPRHLEKADVSLSVDKNTLTALSMGLVTVATAVSEKNMTVNSDPAVLDDFLASLDTFPFWFPIVTP